MVIAIFCSTHMHKTQRIECLEGCLHDIMYKCTHSQSYTPMHGLRKPTATDLGCSNDETIQIHIVSGKWFETNCDRRAE